MDRKEKAIRFALRNEDYKWDTEPRLEVVDDAGQTFVGLNDKYDGPHLAKYGLKTIAELAALHKKDPARAITIIVEIYEEHYWNPLYDRLNSERLAIRLFDQGLPNGVGTAVKKLQIAVSNLGAACVADGKIGPATIAAANACDGDKLLNEFKRLLDARYENIAETEGRDEKGKHNGTFPNAKNLKGWRARLRKDEYDIK